MHGGKTAENTEGSILVGAEGEMKTKICKCASKVAGLVDAIKEVEKKKKFYHYFPVPNLYKT